MPSSRGANAIEEKLGEFCFLNIDHLNKTRTIDFFFNLNISVLPYLLSFMEVGSVETKLQRQKSVRLTFLTCNHYLMIYYHI